MRVLTFVADYANVTANGKLNVLGIFSNINSQSFPYNLPSMFFVAKVSLDIGERPVTRSLAIRLVDQNGKHIFDVGGELTFAHDTEGSVPEVNIVMGLNNILFPAPGRYEFLLQINDENKGSVSIQVNQIPKDT